MNKKGFTLVELLVTVAKGSSGNRSYTASDFCTPSDGDCLCKLKVNW